MSDPEDNCYNYECKDHDLESYHCCLKFQTWDVRKCKDWYQKPPTRKE